MVITTNTGAPDSMGVKFFSAGISACIADAATFPLDTAKVRLQIQGETNNNNINNLKTLNANPKLAVHSAPINASFPSQNLNYNILNATPEMTKFANTEHTSTLNPKITNNSFQHHPVLCSAKNAQINHTYVPSRSMLNVNTNWLKNQNLSTVTTNGTIRYSGVYGTISTIARVEGPSALYNGLVAGLQRQMCFASIRIGMYDFVRGQYETLLLKQNKNSGDNVLIQTKKEPILLAPAKQNMSSGKLLSGSDVGLRILAGITTGGLAVCFAQPADVVKVRLQAQTRNLNLTITTNEIRYKGATDAYRKIYLNEGIKGLWKGILPNMTRNAVINACELVGYDIFKQAILAKTGLSDSLPCHFFAAFGAGFITTLIASPIDVVKTRFMNSAPNTYKGSLHCAYLMLTKEGPKAFYKGFTPSFMRLASWNVVMFVCYEQIKRQITKLTNNNNNVKNINNSVQ